MDFHSQLKTAIKVQTAGVLLRTLPLFAPADRPERFRQAARALMEVSAEAPDTLIVNLGSLFIAGRSTIRDADGILAILEAEAEAAGIRILGPAAPTPDTAPDTVVTSSPPPAALGVDLAEDDAVSVAVIDAEVS